MRTLARLSLIFLLSVARARAADDVTVEARRRDEGLEIVCRALLEAPPDLIWRTLTDYNRLAEFIPGMRSSKVVSRNGRVSIVEQSGEARFLFFTFPIEVTLSSTEHPQSAIDAVLVRGNLKRLEGAYRIEPQPGGRSLLSWKGIIEMDAMPPLFGEMVMRSSIDEQFRGMVREIERREALRRAPQPEPAR